MTRCDVAIIGAGPYGLSAAARLRTIKSLDVHAFGDPMCFWQRNMPVGMLLRSGWAATHIADPNRTLTLEAFQAASGKPFSSPVPRERFVDYGLWYQSRMVPDLDRRKIVRVEEHGKRFHLVLEKGETIIARRVVVAADISSFAWRPPEFAGLPNFLASHPPSQPYSRNFAANQSLVVGLRQPRFTPRA